MDLSATFVFFNSAPDDDEEPIPPPSPPFVVPDFLKEEDGESDNMILQFGIAVYYSTNIESGVRGSDRSKTHRWNHGFMGGEYEDLRQGMRLNRNSFDYMFLKVTPHLGTECDGFGKLRSRCRETNRD